MAITNQESVLRYKVEKGIPLDTELYTYNVWKSKGYQVRKGEKCIHKIGIYKFKSYNKEVNGENVQAGKCFPTVGNFFERSQVEKIK